MKQKLHIFMTLLLLMICGGVSFGQTTETFKFASFTTPKEDISFDGENCTITLTKGTNPPFWSSSKKEARVYAKGSLVVTSDLKITKIVYTFVNNSGTFGSVTPAGYDESTKTWSSVTGSNEVTFNIGGTKGNYGFIQMEITYAGSGKTSTKVSFGTNYDGKIVSIKGGETLETPATLTPAVSGATISYDSSDKTVAEIDKDGIVYAYKEGTTTITASYAGDDTYAASSASYTLNVEDARMATTLTFPTTSYTFDLGSGDQEFTNAAILNPAEAGSVTYKSSNENVAVVGDDGSVVVATDHVGTATITASFAGTDTYKASESSYTITVKELKEAFDFSKPANYGYNTPDENTKNVNIGKGGKVVAGNVTITNVEDGGTATRFYYDIKKETIGLRAYINAKLTVSVPNGFVVTDINITPNATSKCTIGALNKSSVDLDFSEYLQMQSMTVTYAKLPTATLTTAASGFATYAADYDVDYSAAGLKAYAITLDDAAKTVKYTEATGVVPAGKAVLVKGDAMTEYTLAPATEAAGDFTTDLLISDGTETTKGGLYYAFATVDGKSGFKKLADGLTIPAKKGYLKLSAASAKGFFAFDETTTGINEIEAEAAQDNAAIYNLAGQRVSKEYKGVVIKNGKKFFNK